MLEDYEEVNVKVTQTFTIETTVTDFDGHDVVDTDYDATIGRRVTTHSWERGDITKQFLEQHESLNKRIEECVDVLNKLISAGINYVGKNHLNHLRCSLLEWCPSDCEVEEL